MINNRQAGRRRGRNNNPRQNGGGNRGNGDSGNRIDNRARGNAAQLLEKYRNLARDAQLAGDRVNMEYYLQFADHYFRVLADNRARQEEQQQRFRRHDENGDDGYDNGDDGFDQGDEDDGFPSIVTHQPRRESRPPQDNRAQDHRSQDQQGRPPQRERRPRAEDAGEERASAQPSFEPAQGENSANEAEERPVRQRRPRQPRVANDDSGQEGLNLAALPPAIGRSEPAAEAGETPAEDAPAKPRRGRPRRTAEAAE